MSIVTQATRDKMRSDIFGSEVWAQLPWTVKARLWWQRRKAREAFDRVVDTWSDTTEPYVWEVEAGHGVVDPLTLWLIGLVVNLLFSWWLKRRASNEQTLRIMRG